MGVKKSARLGAKLFGHKMSLTGVDFTRHSRPVFTAHHSLIRTTNSLERIRREGHRRTKVAGIFPNEAACLRLVSAILVEIDDNWQT